MLVVETIAKIRGADFVQGKPIKSIVRELRVSRKTVRKVIRSDETQFAYERMSQPQPKIGPWEDELDSLLARNAARPTGERLTLMRVFEELRGLGYDGSCYAVRRYAAAWKRRAPARRAQTLAVPASGYRPAKALPFGRRPWVPLRCRLTG